MPVTFLTLLTFFTLQSCSTEKARWGNIQYHNTTCHYNVWWNGNESLKAGKLKLQKGAVDDYTQFLPVENVGTEEMARSIYPEMDRAIEKGVKGVKKHSIFVKGQEHVPYIKECYLLTAYATFYKHDYPSTLNTCDILVNQFQGTHAADEGAVLAARCMSMDKRYADAEVALDQLVQRLSAGNFTRSQRDKLYLAMVEATVPQQKYKKAVEYIHLALDATHGSYTKARLYFIMAQIYRKLDKRAVAAKYYEEVLSCHPPYVMEFNAKLGQASCADIEHADIARLEKQLDNMLSDKKNEEYRDQIYYAKGEMYLGANNPRKACENYRLSVAAATVNKAQKAQSSLRMGQVQYEVFENYDLAQLYYDTAMQCITADYPGYADIRRRSDILNELVSFTRVYERCDSLVTIAAMPEADRMTLINQKIETLQKEEEEAKERERMQELLNDAREQQNTLTGDWYFYNPQTVQKGKETFRQRWGMRVLEDLWAVENKSVISMLTPDEIEEEMPDDTTAVDDSSHTAKGKPVSQYGNPDDPHDIAYYLKDIPNSQHALDSIDSLTSFALLNAGYVFYDGIHNTPRALECYLRLAEKYTSYDEIVQAFYMLYRIYDRQGNTPQANYYRDMVLMGFPDSDFANLIRDNEYYKELIRRDRRIDSDYEELYTLYASGRYSAALRVAEEAENNYPSNPALHRFRYWKGLALAHKGNREGAIEVFKQLAALPTTDSIQPLAAAQLALLRDSTATALGNTTQDERSETITEADEQRAREKQTIERRAKEEAAQVDNELPPEAQMYRYRPTQPHYVIVLVDERTLRATEVQKQIGDFSNQYYSNSGLKVNASLFTDTSQIITVHRFNTAPEAMGYYRHLQQAESPLRQYPDKDYILFAISTQNYATFYNRKDHNAYNLFFQKYYLKKEE